MIHGFWWWQTVTMIKCYNTYEYLISSSWNLGLWWAMAFCWTQVHRPFRVSPSLFVGAFCCAFGWRRTVTNLHIVTPRTSKMPLPYLGLLQVKSFSTPFYCAFEKTGPNATSQEKSANCKSSTAHPLRAGWTGLPLHLQRLKHRKRSPRCSSKTMQNTVTTTNQMDGREMLTGKVPFAHAWQMYTCGPRSSNTFAAVFCTMLV